MAVRWLLATEGRCQRLWGQAGVVLAPDEAEDWAEAMGQILVDSAKRERMIRAGFERAKQFSWEMAAAQTLRIYQG